MRRIAIVICSLTILGACGSPKTTNGEAGAGETSTTSSSKPAAAAPTTKPARSDACQAMDSFIYDLLIVAKARGEAPAKKQEILTSTAAHANALKVAAPELGLAVDVRLAYAQALLAGEPSQEAKDRELTAKAQFDDWYKTHGCA
ncbi:MAG: hypothetical protein U0Q07_03155 [Acidimicrobiales bacterium]